MRLRASLAVLPITLLFIAPVVAGAQAKPAAPQKPAGPAASESGDAAAMESFERKVRPVLVRSCYPCHSHAANKSLGGLYLDSRAGLLQGGGRGTGLVPGHPDKSLLIDAIQYAKPDLKMPPSGKLPDAVIADLADWVRQGAPWPTAHAAPSLSAADAKKRKHWAWQPVRRPALPAVKHAAWPQTAVDRFVLAKLESRGRTPQPRADKRTLIRRAYYDLIGLPPTPDEVDAFLKDSSPDAWKKLIDRLLASPHYGERWGRYWLDVARYGEDQAHSFEPRLYPQGFRYRDWVCRSLNQDMPYDRFVKEQIAADLLNEPDKMEQLPALGFFACGPVYYGDAKMFDQYDDRIDTLSRGFLGLTVACARCHDHKFDPITQKDYYALAGVFASSAYVEVPLATAASQGGASGGGDRLALIKAKQDEVDKFLAEHTPRVRDGLVPETARAVVAAWKLHNRRKANPKLAAIAADGVEPVVIDRWCDYLFNPARKGRSVFAAWQRLANAEDPKADLSASEPALAEARKAAAEMQDAVQSLIKRHAAKSGAPALTEQESAALDEIVGPEGVLTIPPDQIEKVLTGDPKVHYATIKGALDRLKMGSFIHALADSPRSANMHVLLRGNPDTPGDEAPRRFLTIVAGDSAPLFKQGSGRLELANAIADKSNPLTARVMVNRIWQHHFGRGLVRTTSNFGMLGEPPTHPELLDYLASRFVEQGWSIKAMHREIMLSATYQMSSSVNRKSEEIDADDRLLWRMPRQRLDVEAWRDAMLAVAGKLDTSIGGPSVSLSAPDNNRRTFYAAVSRHELDSMLRLFDFPDPNATTDARMTTTVPLQQLFVLNSDFMVRQAKALAARLTATPGEDDEARIQHAFMLVFSRPPQPREMALGLAFLRSPRSPASPALATTGSAPPSAPGSRLTRWEEYAQVLLSANEFMYVD
jgi:cytochrome c553